MVNDVLCPVCKNMKNRNLFRDGVCAECAESTLVSDRDILSTKPVDYTVKSQTQAQEDAELEFRLQAELERAKKEREEEFNAQQEAQKELARREAARRNLLPFVMYFNEDYIPGWVHADICRRLEKFSRDVAEKKSPRLMLFLPPRSGKLLADSTPILTTKGWITHGELKVGDYVFHPSGKPVKVLAVSDKAHADYIVTFSNGETIRCHGNHEWTVSYDGKDFTVETHVLQVMVQLTSRIHTVFRHFFPGENTRYRVNSVVFAPNGELGHCIQVDSPDGLYLAGRKLIPTHNSEIASKTFPAWHLGHYPNHDIIGCSYSAALAIDFSRKVRGLVQDERYHNIFPTRMDESSQSAERWNTSAGGGYVAAGVQGPITGRGAHIGIIDDPVKDRDSAESETVRQSIKDWYSSTFYTRLAPGGGVLVIMTRWHSDDLAGWLLQCMKEAEQEAADTGEWPDDADRWEVVRYPAIATYDEPYRKAGEALHPERYDLKALNKIKRTLIPRDWEALYQQNPVSSDGDYFKKDFFRYYDTAPPLDTLRIYSAWDLAIGKKETNDFTCGVVVGVDRNSDIWLLHRYYGRFDANELIQQFFHCQRTWNPVLQGIEHGQIEMTLEPFILKEMNEKREKFNYTKLKTRGNDKLTRARPIQGRMEQGRVYFPRNADWAKEMESEMLAFPSGKHDDQVDAIAWIGQMLLMLAPQREHRPAPKKSWRDRLHKNLRAANSSGLSHMAS